MAVLDATGLYDPLTDRKDYSSLPPIIIPQVRQLPHGQVIAPNSSGGTFSISIQLPYSNSDSKTVSPDGIKLKIVSQRQAYVGALKSLKSYKEKWKKYAIDEAKILSTCDEDDTP